MWDWPIPPGHFAYSAEIEWAQVAQAQGLSLYKFVRLPIRKQEYLIALQRTMERMREVQARYGRR